MSTRPMGPQARLYFLGAGFSCPAGLPLANDLLELVLEKVKRAAEPFLKETKGTVGNKTILHSSLDDYRDYVKATTGTAPKKVNFEDFAEYLNYEHTLGLRGSDTLSDEGNGDQLILRWGIGAVLNELTPSVDALPSVYLHFASLLRPGDIVVTFNYDLVLERSLEKVGVAFRRFPHRYSECFTSHSVIDTVRDAGEVILLKMHGSIDWVSRAEFHQNYEKPRADLDDEDRRRFGDKNRIFGSTPYTATHQLVEGPRTNGDPLADVYVLNDPDVYYSRFDTWYSAPPLLLAPSHAKLLYGSELRDFWWGISKSTWGWGGLNVIGYSLPPSDPYTKQVLYKLSCGYVHDREHEGYSIGPQSRIKVIDFRSTDEEIAELKAAYRFLPTAHTDFIIDGFSEAAIESMVAEH